jgi:hypothetical protein
MKNPDQERQNNTQPREHQTEERSREIPEYWGEDKPPAPGEETEFWGEESRFEVKPAIQLGEAKFRPWGGLTVKDLRVDDKETLLILTGGALLLGAMILFGVP